MRIEIRMGKYVLIMYVRMRFVFVCLRACVRACVCVCVYMCLCVYVCVVCVCDI